MRSLLARNETARFTTISGFKSYIFLINQSFWTGSLCFSNRKYTKIADSIKKSADIHYHVNKNTVLLIWCVALGQYIVLFFHHHLTLSIYVLTHTNEMSTSAWFASMTTPSQYFSCQHNMFKLPLNRRFNFSYWFLGILWWNDNVST